jgi:hypothetical protein
MKLIDPDDKKELHFFKQEWESCYTSRNPVKMPTIPTLRHLFAYGTYGSIPGPYLTGLITNDMYATFSECPADELDRVYGTLQYMLVRLPYESYGSPEKMQKWIEKMKKSKMFRPTDLY